MIIDYFRDFFLFINCYHTVTFHLHFSTNPKSIDFLPIWLYMRDGMATNTHLSHFKLLFADKNNKRTKVCKKGLPQSWNF